MLRHAVAVVMVLALLPAAVVQGAAASRHISRAPEELMKEALALEALISWSERCLGIRGEPLRFAESNHALREQLKTLAERVFNGTALLVLGGVHLKALRLLLNGSDEVTVKFVEDVFKFSLYSLVKSGVSYREVEDFIRNPTLTSLFRFYSHVSFHQSDICAKELLFKLLSFVVYLERGNVLKARAVAEEVLTERSMFFGLAMMLVLESTTHVSRKLGPASDRDLPEHILEELVLALKELNIDISEVLSRYSLTELIELYESLRSVKSLTTVLNDSRPFLVHPPGSRITFSPEELEEESLARAILGDRLREPREERDEEVGVSDETPLGFESIAELISRVPPRVTSSAASLVGAASYRSLNPVRQAGATIASSLAARRREPEAVKVGIELFAYILAASAISATFLLIPRGQSGERPRERKLLPVPTHVSARRSNPVIEAFWDLVCALSVENKVEILPSDTHREVVRKLEACLDDVSSALLRRLSKLYEVVRFSREVPEELVARELKALRELMGELQR